MKRLIGFEDISQQFFSVKRKIMLTPRSFLRHRSNRAVLCHDLYDSMLSIGNNDTAGPKIPIRISPRNRSNIRKPVRKSFRCPDGFVQRNKFGGNMTVDQ